MAQLDHLRVGIEYLPYYKDKVLLRLPRAELVEVLSPRDYIENRSDELDAMAMTAESASAWSLLYPQFTAITPASVTIKLPFAFPLPKDEETLADFLKVWIDLKESDGTIDQLYRYWVLGKQDRQRQPRWSVIRDVLHWVE